MTSNTAEFSSQPHQDPTASLSTPRHKGLKYGFFNDKASKALLGLDDGDALLKSGMYGVKELSHMTDFVLLCHRSYDQ